MTGTRETPQKGIVEREQFVVEDIPRFKRTVLKRDSEIERDLAQARSEHGEGATVCIRQYSKRESANGTLYNLRKRHGKPGEDGYDGWEFVVGPLDDYGHPGLVGLFATYNPNGQ